MRQRKGLTLDASRQQLHNYTTYGMMMVRSGDADGSSAASRSRTRRRSARDPGASGATRASACSPACT
jgi:hypothetical protein